MTFLYPILSLIYNKICYNKNMNIYRQLNEITKYIEQHLFEQINLQELSKIIGTNVACFSNIFSLLTGFTPKEYIKNRRLSECGNLLKDNLIIDVAVMCGYDCRASFSRAFKAFHGFNPSKLHSEKNFKYFTRIKFDEAQIPPALVTAKIKHIENLQLYGISSYCNSAQEISSFWDVAKQENSAIKRAGKVYGLVYLSDSVKKFKYYIALPEKFDENATPILIPKGNYISIFLSSKNENEISRLGKNISSKNLLTSPDIEIYSAEGVELLFKK